MAKILDPSATERPIPRLTPSRARLQPVGPSTAPGQGLEILGREAHAGLEEVYRAQKIEEDRINTLRAEDAYTKLQERRLELTVGEQTGFTQQRGAAAVTRPILTEWGRRFQDAETEISAALSNDEQRTRFKRRADVSRLGYQEDMLRHLARESDVYAREVYEGTVATEARNASVHWDSPADVQASLVRVTSAVEDRAERLGWSPAYKQAVLQDESSKIHAGVIGQALASGRYRYAEEWFNKNRESIDTATAKVLERQVADGAQREKAAFYRNQFLAQRDSIPALEELSKQVSGDAGLDLDRQNVLIGPILSRIETLQNKREIERERRLRLLERGVNKLNARTLAGFEPSADEFAPYILAAKGTDLEQEVRGAIALAAGTREFRLSTPPTQERMLNDIEARARTNPASVDPKILGALKTIHESQQTLLRESPVTFAYRQGLADPVPIDWAKPADQAERVIARIGTARGMTQVYGTELKPLLPNEAAEIRARLTGAKTEDQMAWFGNLRMAVGADGAGYSAMMGQIAPDEPALALAGEYSGKGRVDAARLILDGQKILRPPRRSDGTPDQGKLWPMPPDLDIRTRFQSAEGNAFGGNAKYRSMVEQATRAIYAKMSEEAGDATGVINSRRFEDAFRLATGGVESYRGRSVVLPYGMEFSDFRRGLESRIADIGRSGRLTEGLTESQLRDIPLDAIGDGRYAFRVGNGYLVDRQGRKIVVNFNLEPEERPQTGRPMGRGAERMIAPWERQNPAIQNPDGSFSTERTITIESEGRHLLIPTIVGGRERTEEQAITLWRRGENPPVGNYASAQEAEREARARSDRIGREREGQ